MNLETILSDLMKYFNPILAVVGSAIIEVLKPFIKLLIPDNIEKMIYESVIQLVTVIVCVAVGMLVIKTSLVGCLITGIVISGLYKMVMKSLTKIGGGE